MEGECSGGVTADAMGRLKLGAEWTLVVTEEGVHDLAVHEEHEELSRLVSFIPPRSLQVLPELFKRILRALVPYLVQPPLTLAMPLLI